MAWWLAVLLASAGQGERAVRCELEPAQPEARRIVREQPLYCFSYAYPAAARPVPGLETLLLREARRAELQLGRRAARSLRQSPAIALPATRIRYSHHLGWSIAADTPPLLALVGAASAYSGGAREALSYETLLWDRSARRRIRFADLFTDAGAAMRRLHPGFCIALRAARAETHGEVRGEAWLCPIPARELAGRPIALIGEGGRIRSLRVLIAPWSLYVEPVEVDVPLTPELLALVKPRYREAFGVGRPAVSYPSTTLRVVALSID